MASISLVVPLTAGNSTSNGVLEAYRQALTEQGPFEAVEVILAGDRVSIEGDRPDEPRHASPGSGPDRVGSMWDGLSVASGDVVVIVDPTRCYTPEALVRLVSHLVASSAEVAIAVPQRHPARSHVRTIPSQFFGLASRIVLGTSDVFSGLVALKRDPALALIRKMKPRGSRIAMELLSGPSTVKVDVPVGVGLTHGMGLYPLGLNDLRQLKRVLDHRFGTFSRLVQFCIVGASGMVVDLTMYALLQVFFGMIWTPPAGGSAPVSWPIACAGALSILVALIWNFSLNRRLTFNDSRHGSIARQFFTYALGNALGIAVSLTLRLYLPGQYAFFASHRLAAAVVGIVVATGISFSMSRWVVFIKHPPAKDNSPFRPLTVDSLATE